MHSAPIETVACVGSSTTVSKGTYPWIAELESRPQNRRFRFTNFGVGGDLSFNTVRRVGRVAASRPDRVIVLIGANDILANVFPNFRRMARLWKGLRIEPTAERFAENLTGIAQRLRRETDARIALSSLAPVGEDPHSQDPVQSRLNELYATYRDVIRDVSAREGADYIAFYEAFRDELERSQATKPFTRFSFPSFYRDYLVREMILRRSFDEIARINGWQFHIDGIHLNTRGGLILVEAVQGFLDSPEAS
ncbi:SGNH/GDSL hydrolase family protein [Mycobacterium sp.]|uniref:SGNH/GDSL hydrolase family protein n=1 Tax=Mycobacterium sp. TaxID=1785 RepID=UPI0025F706C1|nr:SGNH/GDSL hydrolase family protein [Mycobacterium sp.]MBW0011971.1 SGNH/GDSL hydrolase family protein [Mycobacterium sp.]